jgi:hypothetical protein
MKHSIVASIRNATDNIRVKALDLTYEAHPARRAKADIVTPSRQLSP